MQPILAIVGLVVSALALTSAQGVQVYFDTKARIAQDGYYSENHPVTTSDGYILEMNRIPFGRFQNESSSAVTKPAVFLLHGLGASAIHYIHLGHNLSLAYMLADAGFDVWLGNVRGVLNSRNHIALDPEDDKLEFFDYSFEDLAIKDVPSMIDYVLRLTGQEKLHYIGHSQGGTSFFVLNSMLPEYNDKISAADLLAGVGYMNYFPNLRLKIFAENVDAIYTFARATGNMEINSPNAESDEDCEKSSQSYYKCAIQSVTGIMRDVCTPNELAASASVKQFAHFGQNIRDKTFRRWNYGTLRNIAVYGSAEPPEYDISRITVDTLMHYTVGDDVLDERDVLDMAKDMPNVAVRRVAKDSFSHSDFLTGKDSRELVLEFIVDKLVKMYL